MKAKVRHITLYGIRIFLMAFWLYVALDKLWDLPNFHRSLLKQPFPDWWAAMLFWLLPAIELGIALLFLYDRFFFGSPRHSKDSNPLKHITLSTSSSSVQVLSKGTPYLLSSLLLLIFTLYIGLGVAGLYAKRPCGCASVFSGLSWDWHLLVNIMLLSLSLLGRFLCGPTGPTDHSRIHCGHLASRGQPFLLFVAAPICDRIVFIRKRFPRRFAPFPGRPVYDKPKLHVCRVIVKSTAEVKMICPPR